MQDVQFDWRLEHVRQFEVQAVHCLFMPTNPAEHWDTQVLPYRFRLMHAVQLYAKLTQVAQSAVALQASA